jgi:hypothetical protein
MKRLPLVLALVAGCWIFTASASAADTLCVGGPGCYSTLQKAVNAAHDGDTITIAPGTYAGGVTIDVSVRIVGAGASQTAISGGGPVITIGVAGAASEPTVTIDGVTVRGGVTVGNLDPSTARGGGIYVPRAAGPSTGATVTIRNSVIRDNTVAPGVAADSGIPCPDGVPITCISGDLPVATDGGGGISNDGTMILDHTLVTQNRADAASGLASDADGGGILDRAFGKLTLHNSVVTDNHAEVTAPNGRFADGGGILNNGPSLTIEGSLISNNSAQVTTAFPNGVDTGANSGGVHVQGDDNCASPDEGCTVATIRDSTIAGNSVTASNSIGDSIAFCGGLCDDGVLSLRDSILNNNHVTAIAPKGSPGGASGDSGGFGAGGPITATDVSLTGNTVAASTSTGDAATSTAGGDTGNAGVTSTVSNSVISGNRATSTSASGSVTVLGVGFGNFGAELTIRDTAITANTGAASGSAGTAHGGGIWSDATGGGPSSLTVVDSAITGNSLTGGSGIAIQGGGLFATGPFQLLNSVVAGNSPDQCFGC